MFNILLIGDNPEIARLTARIISRNGFNVKIITDSDEIPTLKPSLLIFDCGLSPEAGFKRYEKLIRYCFQSKILWISSNAQDEIQALEMGADDWIKKPFHMDIFIARIKKLCYKTIKIS